MNKTQSPNPTQKKENTEQGEPKNLSSSKQSEHKTKPRNSAGKTRHTKKGGCFSAPVIVALIGLVGVLGAAFFDIIPDLNLFSRTTPIPTLAPMLTVSISNDVRDRDGNPITMNSAPFEVKVSGTVTNPDGLYVYLIVANSYDHYVQPGLGQNINGDFSVSAYLGLQHVMDGLQYTIYAVVTDKPYAKHTSFNGESYLVKSKEIILTRESSPAPAP